MLVSFARRFVKVYDVCCITSSSTFFCNDASVKVNMPAEAQPYLLSFPSESIALPIRSLNWLLFDIYLLTTSPILLEIDAL